MEDQSSVDSTDNSKSDLQDNVSSRSTWIRLVFMLVFVFLYGISRLVTVAVVVVQFFQVLFTGQANDQLKSLGHSLAIYSFEVIDYLTFNTEIRPYPLDAEWPRDWPDEDDDADGYL